MSDELSTARTVDTILTEELRQKVSELNEKIRQMETEIYKREHRLRVTFDYINAVMKELAILTVLQRTHREKNNRIAHLVNVLDTAKRITEIANEFDAIPL